MPVFYIGRVAKQTALSVHAIRFYEREGLLLTPVRSEGPFRILSEDNVGDLKFICRAQELSFSLTEIRELLVLRRTHPQACAHVRVLLTNAPKRVEEKVADLMKLQHELGERFTEVQPRSEALPGGYREDLPGAGGTRSCRRKAGETQALRSAFSPLTAAPKKNLLNLDPSLGCIIAVTPETQGHHQVKIRGTADLT
jgi:DNA-binding transcriptional MerR regulator